MSKHPQRPTVLLTVPLASALMRKLAEDYHCIHGWDIKDELAQGQQWPQVRAVITTGIAGAPPCLLAALPALELIACVGVGYDAIDLSVLRARSIRLTTTPGVLNQCVADTALALLLSLSRRIVSADRFVRDGRWPQRGFPLSHSLAGKRCGIVGLGGIGRAIARRAEAFEMEICYHGPRAKPEVGYRYYGDLEKMAADVDILILALPGGPSTHAVINAPVLRALGPEGLLINIARGSVVDQAVLVEMLLKGELGGAGLDVFEDEPQVPSALWGLDNVVLTPHIASATVETRQAMAQLMLANLQAHFAGQPLLTPVELR